MNSKHLLVVVALLVGFATFLILSKPMWWREPSAVDPDTLARLQERMLVLERAQEARQKALDETLEALRRGIDRSKLSATPEGVVIPARGASGDGVSESPAGISGPAKTASRSEALTFETALAGILDKKMSWDDREKLWTRIREAGLTDEIIKDLEKRAAANPKDPDSQTLLGNAYLKKIQEVPQGPESGAWATKADQAYDRALEIDPEHWESRFMKAVALSFWPAAFGKGTEAIKHFETLVSQQERQNPRSGFAETYYFLGNMYLQTGQRDQAISAWQRGLRLFPDNAELQQQLRNAGK
jgi:tetratricopeptide (TPR) repeat protein